MNDLPSWHTALAGRYAIEREIGAGGMANVFLARDVRHERNVAIKVFRPELAASGSDRFLREIRVVAQLHHPNILTLIDSGEVAGHLFYVMPYVERDTLRTRLARDGPLPVDDTVKIACEIADALDCAHRHGVIHRDIKPENVMLEDGHAMVTDFGIAYATGQKETDRLTQTGFSLGTPAYMSPEQAMGEVPRDGRGDIYSLGCVVYEMLTGQPPFTGASTIVIMARHAMDPVPSMRAARRTLPIVLEQAVLRALAKAPADRFPTAAEFRDALATTREADSPRASTQADSASRSVAVLPFANMSADPDNEYFSDGITEEIINALAQLRSLHVTARSSAFSFKGTEQDAREVGRRLGVSHVLEGSVRRMGKRLRITVQLIDVTGGYHLWSERFDRELEDVFAVQDEVASAVAKRLRAELSTESLASARPAANLEAYDCYLRGRYFVNKRTEEGVMRALDYFDRALRLDPAYAPAAAAVADARLWMSLGYGDADAASNSVALCRGSAQQALVLDPTLAEAHVVVACLATFHEIDPTLAENEFGQAVKLNPSSADALYWRSYFYTLHRRRYDLALADLARARELDPLRPEVRVWEGYVHYFKGDLITALAHHRATISLDPDFAWAHYALGDALVHSGDCDGALAAFAEAGRLGFKGSLRLLCMLGFTYAHKQEREQALEILAELEERSRRGVRCSYGMAIVHAGLGDREATMTSLERAVDGNESQIMAWIPNTPELALVHDHPRYERLVKALNLSRGRELPAAHGVADSS